MAENPEKSEEELKETENLEIAEKVTETADSPSINEPASATSNEPSIISEENVGEGIKTDVEEKAAKEDDKKEEGTTNTAVENQPEIEKLPDEVDESQTKESAQTEIDQTTENEETAIQEAKIEDTEVAIDEPQKETAGESSNQEVPSTSEDKTPAKRKLSDTPEDILNILKALSPEKLLEVKSKLLEIKDKKETESSDAKKPKTDESSHEKADESQVEQTQPAEPAQSEDARDSADVICLDSDDEGNPETPVETQQNQPEVTESSKEKEDEGTEQAEATSNDQEQTETPPQQEDTHTHLNGDSNKANLKECINPECPRNKDSEYLESPTFVLSMYYITRKPNKIQWVCSTCYEEALQTYESLCSKFMSNEPWIKVKIPKKQDLVEIIDSDEEDDAAEKKNDGENESNKIIFDEQVEKEIEEILTSMTAKVDIRMQLDEEYKYLESKINKNDKLLDEINKDLLQLERKSYSMYDELYSFNRPKIQRRPSLSIEPDISPQSEPTVLTRAASMLDKALPEVSITPIARSQNTVPTPLQKIIPAISQQVEQDTKICYAIRQRGVQMPHWMACKVVEDLSTPEGKKFKVQFCDNLPNSLTIVSGREISVSQFSEKLEIGARVIALFPRSVARTKQPGAIQKRYLPGVIGEKLTQYNKRRYLVFCDYGQVRYCNPDEVRAIQESSENVWDDVHPNLRQFIRDYLESKTNKSRALLNVRVNTQILTERAGNWRKTIVQEVDCSLVRVYFTNEHCTEWLYRGSKRLYTMYQQTQRAQGNTFQRRTDPGAFSYITIDDDESNSGEGASSDIKKNIAKKSTAKPQQPQIQAQPTGVPTAKGPIILNDSFIYMEDPLVVAKVRHFTPKAGICAKKYVKHDCSPTCIPPSKNDLANFSPLSKPLLSCWERQIVRQKNYRYVVYKAPCGRRLRHMHDVFTYLGMTKCALNVDNFDFDPSIQVLSSYYVDKSLCPLFIDDITEGKEGMKVCCINAFDNQRPPPLEYSSKRIPMPGVNINTDPEFMSCCDCTDNCYDKSKCACFQLTIRGAKYKNLMEEVEENISYFWKRLLAVVPTGIYECNSRCKCSSRCLNKVVQEPIRVKMQLYRTKARGWGLQALHDIPKGTFVCIYAGNLYTEKDANALCQGLDHGDEYFAELDLIENAESRKEGFETGITYPDESEEEKDSDSDYDDRNEKDYDDGDFVSKSRASAGKREIVTRSSKTSLTDSKKSSASSTPQRKNSEDSSDDEMVSMIPNANNAGTLAYPEGMRIPFRKLYGPKEKVYIMDAKRCGNVGRYFNHSCDPNLFVQSVFVDTHDMRFPWIAFFAQRPIKAGEELTWNYNYEVGSVPSKVLYCKCGSKNCRGRIL